MHISRHNTGGIKSASLPHLIPYSLSFRLYVVVSCALPLAYAQQIISNFAGSAYRFDGDGQRALQAPLGAVAGVAVDRQGQVYATDPSNHIVVRFTPNGTL